MGFYIGDGEYRIRTVYRLTVGFYVLSEIKMRIIVVSQDFYTALMSASQVNLYFLTVPLSFSRKRQNSLRDLI